MKDKYPCPVCNFSEQYFNTGHYEVCSICGWVDCIIQRDDPDSADGANPISMNEAKRTWHTGESIYPEYPFKPKWEYVDDSCNADWYMEIFTEILEHCDGDWIKGEGDIDGSMLDLIFDFDENTFFNLKHNGLMSEEAYSKSVLLYVKIENLCRTENWERPIEDTAQQRQDIIRLTGEIKALLTYKKGDCLLKCRELQGVVR